MPTTADVRNMTLEDLEGAFALSSGAGWNQRIDDWRMLLTLPGNSFAAVHQDRIVGTAIGIDYGTFGWIAMMLVDPGWRGRGLGARLLRAAMDALPAGRQIRLDATPLGRPLYQRHGFRDEATLTRYVAGGGARSRDPHTADLRTLRPLAPGDLARVSAADAGVFGAQRGALLAWLLEGAPQYAHVIEGPGAPQYCLGRQGRLFDQIGPVVAVEDETACALVRASLAAADGRAVVVDAFDRHGPFTDWLRGCGFSGERPLYRMRTAGTHLSSVEPAAPGGPLEQIAILGPEFA